MLFRYSNLVNFKVRGAGTTAPRSGNPPTSHAPFFQLDLFARQKRLILGAEFHHCGTEFGALVDIAVIDVVPEPF